MENVDGSGCFAIFHLIKKVMPTKVNSPNKGLFMRQWREKGPFDGGTLTS